MQQQKNVPTGIPVPLPVVNPQQKCGGKAGKSSAVSAQPQVQQNCPAQVLPGPVVVGQTTILPVATARRLAAEAPAPPMSKLTVQPVVSTGSPSSTSSANAKSSLRDYRRPKSSSKSSVATNTSAPSSSSGLTPQQLASRFPAAQELLKQSQQAMKAAAAAAAMPGLARPALDASDLVPNKKTKTSASPSAPSNKALYGLPTGLTITEINNKPSSSSSSSKVASSKSTAKSSFPTPQPSFPSSAASGSLNIQMLPVMNPPEPLHRKSGKRLVYPPPPAPASSSAKHPGLPNGLLQMATAATMMQQQQQQPPQQHRHGPTVSSTPGLPGLATKVVPKDLKSQLALSRIGLPAQLGNSAEDPSSQISVSLAQSAASAAVLPAALGPKPPKTPYSSKAVPVKQSRNNNMQKRPTLNSLKKQNGSGGGRQLPYSTAHGGSPASSRSSSRNSSLSPRERPSSANGNGNGGKHKLPLSPSPSSRKKTAQAVYTGPLIPWSKRSGVQPRDSNGWQWVGEGTEQKVYYNVSYLYFSNISSLSAICKLRCEFRIVSIL